jgi:hypothetical protein
MRKSYPSATLPAKTYRTGEQYTVKLPHLCPYSVKRHRDFSPKLETAF